MKLNLTRSVLLIVVGLLLNSTVSTAQKYPANPEFKKNSIATLITGIKSENEGLKKDCIFMSALYGVNETVNPLIEVMRSEKNPKIRVLIALALYKLGDEKGIQAVFEFAKNDNNERVRRTCSSIILEYYGPKMLSLNK